MTTITYKFLNPDQTPFRTAHGCMYTQAVTKSGHNARIGIGPLMTHSKEAMDQCDLKPVVDYAFSNKSDEKQAILHFCSDQSFFIAKLMLQNG